MPFPNPRSGRCYHCFRPIADCICEAIPSIDNRTEVLILQHVAERFHPFNTARIVHRALQNSTLLVDGIDRSASDELPLKKRSGVLYPSSDGILLSDLSPDERPEQLVILDGTWHHARTMMRDTPAIQNLPRYQIAPDAPGRYRIRREPTATSLSTLEATVMALKSLEPETERLDQLIQVFDLMIERQLKYHEAPIGPRRNRRRHRTAMNIPRSLVGDLENVVVAYGETTPGHRGQKRSPRLPVFWVAERLTSGERFSCAIQTPTETSFDETFLGHLDLTAADFLDAASPERFCESWSAFLRPSDVLVVYHQSTLRLLRTIGATIPKSEVLKSIDFPAPEQYHSLEEILEAKKLAVPAISLPGRAGKRLASAIAMVRYLNQLS